MICKGMKAACRLTRVLRVIQGRYRNENMMRLRKEYNRKEINFLIDWTR